MSARFVSEVLRSSPALFLYGNSHNSTNALRDLSTTGHAVTTEDVPPFGSRQFTAATSEYFNVSSNSNLQTGDTDFAFSMWVYPDTSTAAMGLVSKYTGSTGTSEYFVDLDTNRNVVVTMDADSETTKTGSGVLTEDAWNHVVVEHDNGTGIRITINGGATEAIAYTGGNSVETVDFRVGSRTGAATFLNGRLSRLGFWKKVLSSTELTQLYNGGVGLAYAALDNTLKTSLISYWNLDEASGNATDSHTNSYHLTDNNTVTAALGPVTIVPPLGTDTALDICPHPIPYWTFNGSTQEWTVADASTLEVGPHNYSVMAIFRASSAGSGTQQIFSKRKETVPHNFHMAFLHSNNKVQARGSASTKTLGSTAISEDTWYMMHLTNAGRTARSFELDNSEYVSTNDLAALSHGDFDFSYSGWIYLNTAASEYMEIFVKWVGTGDNREHTLYTNNSKFTWDISTDGGAGGSVRRVINGTVLATGRWYHVYLEHDAANNHIGISVDNNTMVTTANTDGVHDGTAPFKFSTSGSTFDGRMASVGFWKRLLTTAERTEMINSGSGMAYSDLTTAHKVSLAAYWNLDEASGNAIDSHVGDGSLDLSDNNTVTAAGGPTGAVWYVNGVEDVKAAISQGDDSNATDLHVGCREDDSGNATGFFQGDIAAVATWNKTLTAAEIQAQFTAFKGRDRMRPSLRNRRYGRRVASGGLF